jgi:hypothetical protein
MPPRAASGALLALSLLALAPEHAFAGDPKPAPAASASASAASPAAPAASAPTAPSATLAPPAAPGAAPAPPAAPSATPAAPPAAQPHGVIVIAIGDAASPAARALAMEVYRDEALRPPIDEGTAQVLAGAPPPANASAKLKEIAELRATVARAESELVMRRLLASIGSDLGAPLVVSVTLDGKRPVARALRSSGAALQRVELGATIETADSGDKTYRWPGATATLRGILGVAEPLRPVAQKAPEPPKPTESRPFYKSPWFWGTAGVMAAAGITVLVLSRTSGGPGEAHLTGRVGP